MQINVRIDLYLFARFYNWIDIVFLEYLYSQLI